MDQRVDQRDPNAYSTKDILTMFVLPALDDLRRQQAAQQVSNDARFDALAAWKNKTLGAILLIAAFLVPVSVPVLAGVLHH